MTPADYVVDQLKSGALKFAVEDPEAEENHPRILSLWRANLLGSSAKGNEYFLKHLLGTDNAVTAEQAPPDKRPEGIAWPDDVPEGKLDLLMTIDFRMTSSTLFSDVVLPAATWYEKHDINTTDMHPFVHSFNPAISPPWQSKTDWEAWKAIAKKFSELAVDHLGTRRDVVAKPLWHDTPEAMATVHGVVKDWRKGECEPVPGKTLPVLAVVERDYTAIYDKMTSIGPLLEKVGMLTKGVPYDVNREVEILRHRNGVAHARRRRRPAEARDRHPRRRRDPAPVGHDERPPRHPRLQERREAHRHQAGRPRGRARGQADHLRRHPGRARAGHHLAGVVGLGVAAGGGTRRSRSTSSGSSPSTPSPGASSSTSTTTGSSAWARRCRSTGRRST